MDANSATARNMGGQTLYKASGLPSGRHTIMLVNKTDGAYTLVDAFQVR